MADSPVPQPHVAYPRIRYTINAGYLISLEDGARWANELWDDPTSPLPANVEYSPTVLLILDKDVKRRGGIGVKFNTFDYRDRSTRRYLIVTQSVDGTWVNDTRESTDIERVRDVSLELREGDVDRNTLGHLERNGEC